MFTIVAKTIYLSSASIIAANQEVINERVAYQALPTILSAQLGRNKVGIDTQNLFVTVFNYSQKENGSLSLRVVVSGTVRDGEIVAPEKGNYNFQLPGWINVFPEGLEAPEGAMTVSGDELLAIYALKEPVKEGEKKRKLWFDVTNNPRLYMTLGLVEDKHCVLDANGAKIQTGTTPEGKPIYQMDTHLVLSFPVGKIDASLRGSGISSGGTISKADQDDVDAFMATLLAVKSSAPAEVSARSL
jgi:hypothetical protein